MKWPTHMEPTFICLRGAAQVYAFEENNLFGVTDDRGRTWMCWPVPHGASLEAAVEAIEAKFERFYLMMRLRGREARPTTLSVISHIDGRNALASQLAVED